MWKALWDTIAQVTGRQVEFKFIHGRGICAILVDGDKAQAQGCGEDLITRNNSELSRIATNNPQEIIQYILRTCMVHLDRYAITPFSESIYSPYTIEASISWRQALEMWLQLKSWIACEDSPF